MCPRDVMTVMTRHALMRLRGAVTMPRAREVCTHECEVQHQQAGDESREAAREHWSKRTGLIARMKDPVASGHKMNANRTGAD